MKATKLLMLALLFLIFSCKKDEVTTPADTCKVSVIDRGTNNKHTYTYDAAGKVATMARDFDGSGSGTISKYLYTFTYDNAGLITKSVWTLDGKPDGSETYTYTSGKISKVSYKDAAGNAGTNNIKYDEAGRIIYFSVETGDPNYDVIQYFAYDANGIQIKRGFKGFDGTIYFEVVTKPVGVAKSPEQLLSKYSLPYDVLTGFAWASALGNTGTIVESFAPDVNGKLSSLGQIKTTNVKVDAKGFISEITTIDDTKVSVTERYTLTNCN
jgi:antitoxin component YwqK of YwqJK toxin-antitoxin module